jgi:hypothetical protein
MATYIVEFGNGFLDGEEIVQTETVEINYCDSIGCMLDTLSMTGWDGVAAEMAGQAYRNGEIVSWGRTFCPETSSDEYCPHCGEQVTKGVNEND